MSALPEFEDTIQWWVAWELRRLTRFYWDDSTANTPVGDIRQAEIHILKTAPHDIIKLYPMIEVRQARRKTLQRVAELQLVDAEISMLQWLIATMRDVAA